MLIAFAHLASGCIWSVRGGGYDISVVCSVETLVASGAG